MTWSVQNVFLLLARITFQLTIRYLSLANLPSTSDIRSGAKDRVTYSMSVNSSGTSVVSRKEGSWRDKSLQSQATPQPRWALECNNGTSYIPLVLSSKWSRQDPYQILTIDRSLCPNVDVTMTGTVPKYQVALQAHRRSLSGAADSESQNSYSGRETLTSPQGMGRNLSSMIQTERDTQVRTLSFRS
jgi:hypothetical protein